MSFTKSFPILEMALLSSFSLKVVQLLRSLTPSNISVIRKILLQKCFLPEVISITNILQIVSFYNIEFFLQKFSILFWTTFSWIGTFLKKFINGRDFQEASYKISFSKNDEIF